MRVAPLALILLAMACRSRVPAEHPRDVYAGLSLSALPDVGATLTGGQYFITTNPKFDFAFEMSATFQGGNDSATQDGKFFQVQAGVRQVASPGHTSHLVFRYGFTWFRATGDPRILDLPGDYLGAYGGLGYEWDISPRWTVGPWVNLSLVDGEGSIGTEVLPQVGIGCIFNF